MSRHRPRINRRQRWGVEAVEAAVTLPLLALAVFATVEIAHRWHVEKMLKIATYEAIKVGASVDGTSQDAIRVFEEHAKAIGIAGAKLDIDESLFDNAEFGERLRLEAFADPEQNKAPTPHVLPFSGDDLTGGRLIYHKEGL